MKRTRRKFSAEFKTKVVLEALSERLTLTELAQKHEIHPNQITQWKREFLEKAPDVFSKGDKAQKAEQDHEQEAEQLYCNRKLRFPRFSQIRFPRLVD